MRKSFFTSFLGVALLLLLCSAALAITESTNVLTIQNGYSKREPISTVLGVPNTVKMRSSAGAGAAAGIGVTASEYGDGSLHTTVLGTTTQSSATLATTEQDLIPVKTFLSSATINVAPTMVMRTKAASTSPGLVWAIIKA